MWYQCFFPLQCTICVRMFAMCLCAFFRFALCKLWLQLYTIAGSRTLRARCVDMRTLSIMNQLFTLKRANRDRDECAVVI